MNRLDGQWEEALKCKRLSKEKLTVVQHNNNEERCTFVHE